MSVCIHRRESSNLLPRVLVHVGLWALLYCGQFRSPTTYSPPNVPFWHLVLLIVLSAAVTITMASALSLLAQRWIKPLPTALSNAWKLLVRLAALVVIVASAVQYREMVGYGLGREVPKWPLMLVAAACAWVIFRGQPERRQALERSVTALGLMTLAFGIIGHAWFALAGSSRSVNAPPANSAQPAARLLVVVFDELDGALSLPSQRADLASWMPNVAELLGRGAVLSVASSSADNTFEAVPSILAGRVVKSTDKQSMTPAWRDSGGEIRHGFGDVLRTGLLNTDSRLRGRSVGYIGWYHPYCRYLPAPDDCAQVDATSDLMGGFLYVHNSTAWCRILGLCLWSSEKATHAYRSIRLLEEARRLLVDHSVLFVHLPVPHPPCSRLNMDGDALHVGPERRDCGYRDSVALADAVIGRLVRTAEQVCQGCTVTLAATSDHPYRLWLQSEDQVRATLANVGASFSPSLARDLESSRATLRVPLLVFGNRLQAQVCDRSLGNEALIEIAVEAEAAGNSGQVFRCSQGQVLSRQ